MAVSYDPFDAAYRQDPYPTYRALREQAPVHWAEGTGVFCVSHYDDVVAVLRQPQRFSSEAMRTVMMPRGLAQASLGQKLRALATFVWKGRVNPFRRQIPRNLITEDPPHHDVMRAVVNRGFTPRRIEGWRKRAEEIVSSRIAALRDDGPFDVIADLAIPLPVTLIAEMLGIPPERRHDFKRWSDAIVSQATGSGRDAFPMAMIESVSELYGYLRGVVAERRRRPTDDLIGLIVTAQENDDAVLQAPEVLQFVLLLLVAGNETTTNLIGNAVCALLRHPDALAWVAADPGRIPALVEETLRWDPPVQYVFRTAREDTEIRGTPIARGDIVCAILASANRDEARFASGDRFDPSGDPRGHLGFGLGVHFCLGASLARLEAAAALTALVPQLPRMQRATEGPLDLVDSFLVRGPAELVLVPKG